MAESITLDTRPSKKLVITALQGCDLKIAATVSTGLQGKNFDLYVMDLDGNTKISITSASGAITESEGAWEATIPFASLLSSLMDKKTYRFVVRYWGDDDTHKLPCMYGDLLMDWGI